MLDPLRYLLLYTAFIQPAARCTQPVRLYVPNTVGHATHKPLAVVQTKLISSLSCICHFENLKIVGSTSSPMGALAEHLIL